MTTETIRSIKTLDGKHLDVCTDGLVYGLASSINRVCLGKGTLFAFIETAPLFDYDEIDALIRRLKKAEAKLGRDADVLALIAEEQRLEEAALAKAAEAARIAQFKADVREGA